MKILRGMRIRKFLANILTQIVLCAVATIFLIPFIWMFLASFMTPPQIVSYPPQWMPQPWTLQNYINGFTSAPFLTYFINTFLVVFLSIAGTVLTSTFTAFGFARLRSKFMKPLFFLLLSTMMIPNTVTLLPLYNLYSKFHLTNTFFPLILPSFLGGGAFAVFLLRQFFKGIPKELGESALLDGCSWVKVLLHIYIPNTKPAIVVVIINTFVTAWNDYFLPLIYLNSPSKFTISIGLNMFRGQIVYGNATQTGPLLAMAIATIIPVLCMYLFFQRYFVEGVTLSGVKG